MAYFIMTKKGIQGRFEVSLKKDSHQGPGIKLFTVQNKTVTDADNPAQAGAFNLPDGKTLVGLQDSLIVAAKTYLSAS